jgi:hypothetical protein
VRAGQDAHHAESPPAPGKESHGLSKLNSVRVWITEVIHTGDESRRNSRRAVSPDGPKQKPGRIRDISSELEISTGTAASGVIAPDSLERR